MGGVLPGHVIGEDVAADEAALRGVGLVAEGHSGAFDDDVRAAESETAGALVRGGRRVVVAPEGVGIAEFVDQGGAESADEGEDSGIGPVGIALPGGGHGVDFAGSEGAIAIVGEAHEGGIRGADAVIEAGVVAGGDAGEAAEGGVGGDAGEDAALVIVFVCGEEKEAVLDDGSAEP